MISKSDFTLFLESPMHLWAEKHNQLEDSLPTRHQKYLIDQGYQIENLAISFLREFLDQHINDRDVHIQSTFTNHPFTTRIDAAVFDVTQDTWDLFEIKSGTSARKEDLYDLTFSYLVCDGTIEIKDTYLVHLNKNYLHQREIELDKLFTIEKTTPKTHNLAPELRQLMGQANQIARRPSQDGIEGCLKPKTCRCPNLCHPDQPEYSIYSIPRLGKKKTTKLIEMGVLSMYDLPEDYPLTELQSRQVEAVKSGVPLVDVKAIKKVLKSLVFPLYFLDYETCNPGIPLYHGYRPYQHVVFQYSLHKLDQNGKLTHSEYLGVGNEDPEPGLLKRLVDDIGPSGSVIVWNKSFEANRNKEMGIRNSQFLDWLTNLNERMFDLMDVFRKGFYVHRDFLGSYSIKNILPVLLPEFEHSYKDLIIPKGDEAMVTWWEIISGGLNQNSIDEMAEGLLEYCKMDTLAMVEIWKVLEEQK
jgi:hypothetical protein